MFIYIILRPANGRILVDKWICKSDCDSCKIRFLCFTQMWRTFRHQDDYGIFLEEDIMCDFTSFSYCCRLVTGSKWDEETNHYVPEV